MLNNDVTDKKDNDNDVADKKENDNDEATKKTMTNMTNFNWVFQSPEAPSPQTSHPGSLFQQQSPKYVKYEKYKQMTKQLQILGPYFHSNRLNIKITKK